MGIGGSIIIFNFKWRHYLPLKKTNISLNFWVKMVSKVRFKYKSEEMRLMGRFMKCFQSTEKGKEKFIAWGSLVR